MAEAQTNILQFAPFSSALDSGFWHVLSKNKLEIYGLDDSDKAIQGFYSNGDVAGITGRLNVDYTAFESDAESPPRCFPAHGTLRNTNTIDMFKTIDKQQLINAIGDQIWSDVISDRAVEDPSLLSRFLMLTFIDLKKYHYYYWFAFPCLCLPTGVTLQSDVVTIDKVFTETQIANLLESYITFQSLHPATGYFIIHDNGTDITVDVLCNIEKYLNATKKIHIGFADPCTLDSNPGWPLRNLLVLLAYKWGERLQDVSVVCLRDRTTKGHRDITHSLTFTVHLTSIASITECPKVIGWERNEKNKLSPRMVNMSASMDPVKLSESAVDLNLKLMRWRLLPELNLETISTTKCLLLGSGTLGCNVARCLMGWGVRTITMVDNGKVSYSNPVRQSLFVFDDCLDGGRHKAEAAAESLRRIFPSIKASSVNLSVPMPGHFVTESAIPQVRADIEKLENLICEHDAVFLLMDTRESRWLPTMIAAAKKKIVINAALGFDTFLVLRHGVALASAAEQIAAMSAGSSVLGGTIPGNLLGCYFCNDVVAPGNSTNDRTLDQQCTVSRPGVSMIAAALAAELLVSVLQHPKGPHAPADTSSKDENLESDLVSELGLVPHQIRGFLSRFHQLMPACHAFKQCTACSQIVLDHYESAGFEFLLRVFNEPSYLEDLTGLTEMHQQTMDAEVWDFSDDDSCGST